MSAGGEAADGPAPGGGQDGAAGRPSDGSGTLEATRWLAVAAVLATLGTSLQVMYHFIDVVGLPTRFLLVVAVAAIAAVPTARLIGPATALAVGAGVLAVGLAWYLGQISSDPSLLVLVGDTFELLGGESLLRIDNIRAWVIGVAPAPVFVTTYLAIRGRYAAAVLVAGATLGFFVLTTDANRVTTVSGMVAGAVALALGDLDRRGESVRAAEGIVVVAALMIVVPFAVSVVPPAAASTTGIVPDLGSGGTVETSLVGTDSSIDVKGSITLSPEVRFTVRSERPARWRVASFDRYTGDGWVRTGSNDPYAERNLRRPVGPARSLRQRYRAESAVDVSPAAWRPQSAGGDPSFEVARDGSLVPSRPLEAGDSYEVRSAVPQPSPSALQSAGTDYPAGIEARYTRLPETTPDRLRQSTATITANAETPYETAAVVENWLRNNKNYSLDVQRPRRDVADAFLHDMEAGYCTYFATTMVAMLRSQGIPARFVVGYDTGQRVGPNSWVVRGYDSHAWVEVYFPEYGWVSFDPTPGGARGAVEEATLQRARAQNQSNVDTSETTRTPAGPTPTPSSDPDDPGATPTPDDPGSSPNVSRPTATPPPGIVTNESFFENADRSRNPLSDLRVPSRQALGLWLVAVVGLAAAVRRSRLGRRVYRTGWLYLQRRRDPATDVERAFQRLQYHLESERYRTRQPGETARDYFDAIDADADARRVLEIRERARYGGSVSRAEADEAVDLVDDLVRPW